MRRVPTPPVLFVVAVMLATIGMTRTTPLARAAEPVGVAVSGAIQTGESRSNTFDVFATDDGAGAIAGSFSTQVDGFPLDGTVTCLSVSGNTVVVGGSGAYWDGFDNVTRYQTMFFTDNGPTGTSDTAAFTSPRAT